MNGAVLVTGAGGFVGRHLVRELRRRGISVPDTPRRDIGPRTEWTDALAGVHTVVHLAALAHERGAVLEAAGDYEGLRTVNALGAERLAQACVAADVKHFIFTSTIGVCGDETFGTAFTEESPAAPCSLYAASKLEAEQRLTEVSRGSGLRLTILRPTLVYGPGNAGNMLRLLRLIHQGWPLPFKSIHNMRSLTYVGNLVSAIAYSLVQTNGGGTFVVCDDRPVSTPDLIRCMAAGMGRSARLLPCPMPLLQMAGIVTRQDSVIRRLTGSLEADCGRFSRQFDWRPPTRTQDALKATAHWYCSTKGAGRSG